MFDEALLHCGATDDRLDVSLGAIDGPSGVS
jgi:hypothetical protein